MGKCDFSRRCQPASCLENIDPYLSLYTSIIFKWDINEYVKHEPSKPLEDITENSFQCYHEETLSNYD